MRSVIRPALVGLAAVTMTLGGAGAALASGHHGGDHVNVQSWKWSSSIEDSFNTCSYSIGAVCFGDLNQD